MPKGKEADGLLRRYIYCALEENASSVCPWSNRDKTDCWQVQITEMLGEVKVPKDAFPQMPEALMAAK